MRRAGYFTTALAFMGATVFASAFAVSCGIGGDLSPPHPPCGTATCENGAFLIKPLLQPITKDDLTNLQIVVCRNQICATTQPAKSDGMLVCSAFGPLATDCSIDASGAAPQLHISFLGQVDDFRDGDHYVVRVEKAGDAPLTLFDNVVNYDVAHPNGESCEPMCRSASLE